jgi:hypothetical protein
MQCYLTKANSIIPLICKQNMLPGTRVHVGALWGLQEKSDLNLHHATCDLYLLASLKPAVGETVLMNQMARSYRSIPFCYTLMPLKASFQTSGNICSSSVFVPN